jgi:hypothetical protein
VVLIIQYKKLLLHTYLESMSFCLQIKQMDTFGCLLVSVAPIILFVMNAIWFYKIVKGLKKTLAKRHVE